MEAHETAVIDSGAKIGRGTKIWHFCHISAHAVIGKNCVIGQNVYVGPHVVIGNNCKIQNNVSIFSGVTLENDVFIGPHVAFTNVLYPRAMINQKLNFLPTRVQFGATIGANATILCGISIGQYALIGAGCVVTKGVPDFAVIVSQPCYRIGKTDKIARKIVWEG